MSLRYPRLTLIATAMIASELAVLQASGEAYGWIIGLVVSVLVIAMGENPTTVPPKE